MFEVKLSFVHDCFTRELDRGLDEKQLEKVETKFPGSLPRSWNMVLPFECGQHRNRCFSTTHQN
jgi:hypothetical protein